MRQVLLGGLLQGQQFRRARAFGVEHQVAHCTRARFHGGDAAELARQGEREQSDTRIEVGRGFAFGAFQRDFYQSIQEEAIHLKKGIAAHPELAAIIERAFHHARNFVGAPVEETAGHRPLGFEHVDLHLGLIGEDFNGPHKLGPAVGAGHTVQCGDGLLHFR